MYEKYGWEIKKKNCVKKVLNIVTFAFAADEGTYLVILRCNN